MTTLVDLVRVLELQLPARPRLPAWLVPIDLGDNRLQLRSPRSTLTLRAPELTETFALIQDHLDGRHDVDHLRRQGGDRAGYVKLLLKMLRAHGFLEEAAPAPELAAADVARYDRQLKVLGQLGADPLSLLVQLRTARVLVVGSRDLTSGLADALSACAVTAEQVSDVAPCDLLIGCFEGSGMGPARRINAECVDSGVRFLPMFVDGPTATLGPTVIPRQTACLECLEYRRASTQRVPDDWVRYRRQVDSLPGRDTGLLGPLVRIAADQAALEVVRLLTGVAPPATVGTLFEWSLDSPLTERQTVLKVPRCEVCSRRVPAPEAWDLSLASLETLP